MEKIVPIILLIGVILIQALHFAGTHQFMQLLASGETMESTLMTSLKYSTPAACQPQL